MLIVFAFLALHFYSLGFSPYFQTLLQRNLLILHLLLRIDRLDIHLHFVKIVLIVLLDIYPVHEKVKELLLTCPKQWNIFMFWLAAEFYLLNRMKRLKLFLTEKATVLLRFKEVNDVGKTFLCYKSGVERCQT